MASKLPLLSAQLAFAMEGERTGRRASVCLQFSTPAQRLSARDVDEVLQSVMRTNPALSYRPRFARGEAYQEWSPAECDFEEAHADSGDSAALRVVELVARFEGALDGAPMLACLIRTPDADRLVIVLDHALVDQQSLLLVSRQLRAPRNPDVGARSLFAAAVIQRFEFEKAAGDDSAVMFWAERLRARIGDFPQVRRGTATTVPAVALPSVAVPRAVRGSLFPYVLFSLHRAVRDSSPDSGASVLGYPWGGRDPRFSDLVGCFMNTALSIDTSGLRSASAGGFRDAWFDDLDNINVPITRLMGLGCGFTGAVTAYLSYSSTWLRTVDIAGTEAVLMPPSYAEIPVTSTFQAAATVGDDELHPWLFVDEHVLGCKTEELGERWRHWLSRAMSG